MLSSAETPRPLPPAKARRANARNSMSSTPPPAYGSPFTFPRRTAPHLSGLDNLEHGHGKILGSPMATTFQMVGWGVDSDAGVVEGEADWMSEKSREELKELLFKADGIIKERENELGLTSAVCKNLYDNHVVLQSKHEALLSRIPMSPARSTSSPEHLSRLSRSSTTSLSYSNSESALGNPSPLSRQHHGHRHTRKVSIASTDISMLADQNAELLDKLQRLEEEATSADAAGRRELKRLEKEITFLREALEKTQAKSEALEEKVQDAVVGEAWRRKKEREAKFRAMRSARRGEDVEEVKSFAPEGSKFGGPSDAFTFFPSAESPRQQGLSSSSSTSDLHLGSLAPAEHALITQLLKKVQELEETNSKILTQQTETANQLSAVQRDTVAIAKVYECLGDQDSVELELEVETEHEEPQFVDEEQDDADINAARNTIRFSSLRRSIERDMVANGTCIVHPDFGAAAASSTKARKTVLGLFDERRQDSGGVEDDSSGDKSSSLWSEGHDCSSWSSIASVAVGGGSLSPLHFFSPLSQSHSQSQSQSHSRSHSYSHAPGDLSPLGPSLQKELEQQLGPGAWNIPMGLSSSGGRGPSHLRTSSLYDFSQISVPPSPSPESRSAARRGSDELDFEAMKKMKAASHVGLGIGNASARDAGKGEDSEEEEERTPLLGAGHANSLKLSLEPPTPVKAESQKACSATPTTAPVIANAKSPRIQMISETIRSRTHRWVDRRFKDRKASQRDGERKWRAGADDESEEDDQVATVKAGGVVGMPKRLSLAVDNMVESFQTLNGGRTDKRKAKARSRANYTDEEAEYDRDEDDDGAYDSPSPSPFTPRRLDQHNALQLHVDTSPEGYETNNEENRSLVKTDASPQKKADAGQGSMLLQAWLWLQFVIIILVFLVTMAKKGPAVVLSEENRHRDRRAVVRRR
ncbi:hypothetical protein NLJ89_g5044 [Agrocybe chaxingu]|uniref:Uncharacterized protein n=1 Tax=Agrocybe chaxingu TaxID=84603 RepID=A0A9W8K1K6_9AGAR|nr:hypothetical protein NLJ89_g5044 [Agrocybe chaxingu]